MSEREQGPSEDDETERDETVQDLDVPESQGEDVTGGRRDGTITMHDVTGGVISQ
jgi:hypothetical protein